MVGVLGRQEFGIAPVERRPVQVAEVGIAPALATACGVIDSARRLIDADDVEYNAAVGHLVLQLAGPRIVEMELPRTGALRVPERLAAIGGDMEVGRVVVPGRERVEVGLAFLDNGAHGAGIEVHGRDAVGLAPMVGGDEEELLPIEVPPERVSAEVHGRKIVQAGRIDVRPHQAAGPGVDH